MANKQTLNLLSQQRVDIPDLRSIESGIIFDLKTLIQFMAGNDPYILKGFTIPVSGINGPATSLQMVVDGAMVWVPGDTNGSFLRVETGTPNEVLSPSNTKVVGSFSPGTNFVGIRFNRATDPTTNDLVSVWDVDSETEFTVTAPRGLVMNYEIVIDGASFGSTAPVAIVTVSGSNVTQILNCKTSPFRLGRGGASPNINYNHTFSVNPENALLATSNSSPDPFAGGDWELTTFKQWADAVMTQLKAILGTPFWYSSGAISSLNLLDLWHDASGSVLTGRGRFKHDTATPGMLTWTSDLLLRSIVSARTFTIPLGNITLTEGQVAYVQLVRNQDFQPANTFTFTAASPTITAAITITGIVAGDYIKGIADSEASWRQVQSVVGTTITLTSNYPSSSIQKALRSQGTGYTVVAANPDSVPANINVYWLAKRETVANSATIETIGNSGAQRSGDIATILTTAAHGYVEGQSVIIAGVSDSTFNGQVEILSVPTPTTFTYLNEGPDVGATTAGGGSISAAAKIYLRWLGEIDQGEEKQIDDTVSQDTLRYIGAKSEVDFQPQYINFSTGSLNLPNFNTTANENLTARIARITAMLADARQDFNIHFDPGVVTWDGSTVTITGAKLSIPGTTIGTAPVDINTVNTALADNDAVYVDISRTVGTALTAAVLGLVSLTPVQQRLVVARRLAGNLHLRAS